MKKTILVEEDKSRYLNLLQEALTLKGYKVMEVANGEETVKQARLQRPDLIILNTQIPLRLKTAQKLKEDSETSKIPVWALSANNLPREREKFIEAGCEDYHLKPMDMNQARLFLEKIDDQFPDDGQ